MGQLGGARAPSPARGSRVAESCLRGRVAGSAGPLPGGARELWLGRSPEGESCLRGLAGGERKQTSVGGSSALGSVHVWGEGSGNEQWRCMRVPRVSTRVSTSRGQRPSPSVAATPGATPEKSTGPRRARERTWIAGLHSTGQTHPEDERFGQAPRLCVQDVWAVGGTQALTAPGRVAFWPQPLQRAERQLLEHVRRSPPLAARTPASLPQLLGGAGRSGGMGPARSWDQDTVQSTLWLPSRCPPEPGPPRGVL